MNPSPSARHSALALAGFILVTFCAPLAGMFSQPGAWHTALDRPTWNPPAWVSGPAWTLLDTLMAIAAWLGWRRDGWRRPLRLYFVQLLVNAAWIPIFFGAHQLGWALVEIVVLWIAILLTLQGFLRVNKTAGRLLRRIWPGARLRPSSI